MEYSDIHPIPPVPSRYGGRGLEFGGGSPQHIGKAYSRGSGGDINIDCDADPFVPEEWSIAENGHRKGGLFTWGTSHVRLWTAPGQKGDELVEGTFLRFLLADEPVLNANVLDFLLAYPHLIPEKWKRLRIPFWGTEYRNRDKYLCVRFLYWGGCWLSGDYCVERGFGVLNPAILRAD